MLRILKFLFTGDWHLHIWEPYGNVNKMYAPGDFQKNDLPYAKQQSFKCKHCGEVKLFNV